MHRSRTPFPLRCASLVAGAALLLSLPAAASAVPVVGTVHDRGGDAHNGAQDIREAGVGYDSSGVVNAVVVTAAPALAPRVSIVTVGVGSASKRRGLCRVRFQADILTAKPGHPQGLFGSLELKGKDLRFQAVTQHGSTLQFNTLAGDDIGLSRGPIPKIASKPWNCAVVLTFGPKSKHHGKGDYVNDDATRVIPLLPGSAPTPSCTVPRRKVRRRGRIRVSCHHVAGKITVRFHRHQHLVRARGAAVRGGHARVRARGLRHGWNDISIWQRGAMIGNGSVRVR